MNDDLISRQAAIDALAGWKISPIVLAPVPSEPQWIPCSERLPEEVDVLCCDNHGEMLIAYPFKCDGSDTGFSAESEDCYMYNCVAWMPLPEPYKGEES